MWKKGQPSPNPKGRPRYKTLSESLRAFLEQPIDNRRPNSMTVAEAIATGVLDKARGKKSKADVRAFEAVRDTVEGKPAQRVHIEGGFESKERERQVRFLSHTIKRTYEELGGKVTVEEIWQVVEGREREIFAEDVSPLKEAVLATVMGQKQIEGTK